MPQGLQVWDENGNQQLDVSDKVTTILTVLSTSAVDVVLNYSNDLFLTNDYFYLITPTAVAIKNTAFSADVSVSGDTLTINITGNDKPRTIYVGVY